LVIHYARRQQQSVKLIPPITELKFKFGIYFTHETIKLTANNFDFFNKYFEMIPATSDNLKNEAYKLRYQVYCVENMFLNPELYTVCLEFDEFDQQSIQYLILHRKSGDYIATVRLIFPDTNNPKHLLLLEQHCEIDNITLAQQIDRNHLAEVSRFCISKTFTKRNITLEEKQTIPYISIALIACIIKASHENNIHYWYAIMDRSLIRFLSKLGINFIKIGPQVDYHGLRWPTAIKITDLLDGVAEKNQDMWDFLTNKGTLIAGQSLIKVSNSKTKQPIGALQKLNQNSP
jgi:N-acyl amino acid synthase of PEP-CTERM/exosortase system